MTFQERADLIAQVAKNGGDVRAVALEQIREAVNDVRDRTVELLFGVKE